jgi:hypothetical protein
MEWICIFLEILFKDKKIFSQIPSICRPVVIYSYTNRKLHLSFKRRRKNKQKLQICLQMSKKNFIYRYRIQLSNRRRKKLYQVVLRN